MLADSLYNLRLSHGNLLTVCPFRYNRSIVIDSMFSRIRSRIPLKLRQIVIGEHRIIKVGNIKTWVHCTVRKVQFGSLGLATETGDLYVEPGFSGLPGPTCTCWINND